MQELSWEVKTGGTCMVTVMQSYIWLCMQLASPAVQYRDRVPEPQCSIVSVLAGQGTDCRLCTYCSIM